MSARVELLLEVLVEMSSAAARLAWSCSGLLAPMIGAVMALLASTQATARVTRLGGGLRTSAP